MARKKVRIAVVGDVILDKYSYGDVSRISPEAPIPIILVEKEEYKPGGAGNVAANLATLGADVDLFGVVGNDPNKEMLLKTLTDFKINAKLIGDSERPTIVKQRFIARGQQLLRADYEKSTILHHHHLKEIKDSFGKYDAILVSDYAKGMICEDLMEFLKTQKIPIFVDPKPKNKKLYKDVFFISPNIKECLEMSHEENDISGAKTLCVELNTNVLLTRSSLGVGLISKGKEPLLIKQDIKEVVDVTGAGDTTIATFVYFYTQGYSLDKAAELANKAGGIAVTKIGCYQIKYEDLMN